jgi:N utilization substance protein B
MRRGYGGGGDSAPYARVMRKMTRTAAREIAFKLCFSQNENPTPPEVLLGHFFDEEYYASLQSDDDAVFSEYPDARQLEYIGKIIRGVALHGAELDGYIEKYAVGWRFGRISRVAVALMKLAMFELLYMPDVPNKVAINEALELAKRYDEERVVPFMNGVLGTFARSEVAHL